MKRIMDRKKDRKRNSQNRNSRTLLTVLAAVFLTASLTACGGPKQENGTEADAGTESGVSDTGKAPGAASEGAQAGAEETAEIRFEAKDMDGNTVSESVFSGSKLTMVNVWATYCNPCLSEMPELGELAGEYDPETFQIIGVISDVQEGADAGQTEYAAQLIAGTGADYTHLLLNESLFYALLSDVSAVPTTFFVDENGNVLDTVVGAMKKSAWKEKIDALLEE